LSDRIKTIYDNLSAKGGENGDCSTKPLIERPHCIQMMEDALKAIATMDVLDRTPLDDEESAALSSLQILL
jgi:hypothetical protein